MLPTGARYAARTAAAAAAAATATTKTAVSQQQPRMNTNLALAAAALVAASAYGLYVRNQQPIRADDGSPAKFFGGFPPLKSLKLHSAEMVNHNTKKLRFEFPDKEAVSGLALTSATLTISFPGGGWKPVPRPYTPVSDLNQKGYVEYLIKHYPGGKGSTAMHELKPGDSVYFMPIPGYKWTPNRHAHVAMVAGGAGITPMYQLARAILADPASDKTRVTLVWGVNEDRDLFLADEFGELQRRHPDRFRAVYAVSNPGAGSAHTRGYVTRELLRDAGVLPPKDASAVDDTKVLVCGPPAMEAALTGSKGWGGGGGDGGVLGAMGFTKAQIHRF